MSVCRSVCLPFCLCVSASLSYLEHFHHLCHMFQFAFTALWERSLLLVTRLSRTTLLCQSSATLHPIHILYRMILFDIVTFYDAHPASWIYILLFQILSDSVLKSSHLPASVMTEEEFTWAVGIVKSRSVILDNQVRADVLFASWIVLWCSSIIWGRWATFSILIASPFSPFISLCFFLSLHLSFSIRLFQF